MYLIDTTLMESIQNKSSGDEKLLEMKLFWDSTLRLS